MPALSRFVVANAAWLLSQAPAYRAFRTAVDQPRETQRRRLLEILRANAASDYGRRFEFARVATEREYQDAVPVATADDLAPWIDAVGDGRLNVLTTEPVLVMEATGGSTGGAKPVPYTASLLREIQRAVGAWLVDLYTHRPALLRGGAYWSVSPPARPREMTRGGIPVGFAADTEYFGRVGRWALRRLILTPPELASVPDMTASRYVALRFLLDTPDLAFVSVWHPSFLTLLVEPLARWAPQLVDDVARGRLTGPAPLPPALAAALTRRLRPRPQRASELRALLASTGTLRPVDVWPRLRLISCWTDGAAAHFAGDLAASFPGVEIQGKGLLATEGVVSIPLVGHRGAAIAVTSHFYEFADLDDPRMRPRLADEVEVGRKYAVLLTTGGGLYRYALGDAVRVVGHVGNTPLVRFVGRTGQVSDLCGEKLVEAHVTSVLERAVASVAVRSTFLMLVPEWDRPPGYVLLAESTASDVRLADLAAAVERGLRENPAYSHCRALGQLGAVRACRVGPTAVARYVERCVALGQRAGAIKPVALHRDTGWTEHLTQRAERSGTAGRLTRASGTDRTADHPVPPADGAPAPDAPVRSFVGAGTAGDHS
jgi:hypothetical protein